MPGESFIDVEFFQRRKARQPICGDVFVSHKIKEEGRIISVLSDGLGSGVKASVLANLTAAMSIKYASSFVDVRDSARTIMDTLPICEVRKISYSTFTIVDLDDEGAARVIEHGNPDFILLRSDGEVFVEKSTLTLEQWKDRLISVCEFRLQLGDRLICFSDGVTQSGMGRADLPLGWGRENAVSLAASIVRSDPEVSSQQLSQLFVERALANDGGQAKDDITCGVVHFRCPRRLLVMTGPPFSKERDAELAELARTFPGRKAVCGGTTATIIARLLGREIIMDLSRTDGEVPPTSKMDGVDLITEGTLTLAKVADLLETGVRLEQLRPNAVGDLIRIMLGSDIVQFAVGTRINEAHQDPNIPVELDLRRNIVRRVAGLLESRYLKETSVRFL